MTETIEDYCCVGKRGNAGREWHKRHGIPVCENAREAVRVASRERRAKGPRHKRVQWTPGTPILVPEIDPL